MPGMAGRLSGAARHSGPFAGRPVRCAKSYPDTHSNYAPLAQGAFAADVGKLGGVELSRKLSIALAVGFVLALTTAPVSAIQFAEPDGDDHPQVGLMVAFVTHPDSQALVPVWRCSGALLAADLYLTAGHCVSGADHVEIWFDSGYPTQIPLGAGYPSATPGDPCDGITGYPCTGDVGGDPIPHPNYDDFAAFPATFDIGVVTLDEPQAGPYASLAPLGTIDQLVTRSRKGPQFDLVGYGLQDALPPSITAERTRYFGQAKLVDTTGQYSAGYSVQLTGAPGTGGALCFGDSGGPVFLTGTTTIVAVNSFVLNSQCMGSAFSYRTDTADSLSFVNSFLP
jgi:hypothetical protein